ncbi:MAG: glycosyltransferase family 4 protein [Rhodospirillales bacterium]|nr:glycosyltransferase family 4 protein [Alphaproteobacteria bacterium]MCB1840323.1 glycosyltransferase family 4 protein [Alphaproteobacteria bacterium]MCB9976976.1 glycosyltransferase family 4 protein [Rhodospirillales bacterium]
MRDLAKAFAREGWHVTIITTGPKAMKERDGGIRIIRVKAPERPRGMFSYLVIWLKMFFAAMRLKGRHLVVTMSDPPLIVVAGKLVAKFKKSRHINWCHDLYPDVIPALGINMPGFLMNFFKKQSRKAMQSCDKVIVTGRCMAKHLTYEGLNPKQITTIPNWPDIEILEAPPPADGDGQFFTVPTVNGARPYNELLKEKQKFRVLYAGNIGLAHPIDAIIDAAEILEEELNDVEFVFVGDGERFDYIAKQRSDRGLENIRLLPYQPVERLREVMESGDVHLVSMKEEAAGFVVPSKLYTALAVARPCIFMGPAQSETAKVIKDFQTGKVIPQGDARALADAIREYRMSGQEWFAAHGGAARAREVFTPSGSINAWMERAWDSVQEDLRKSA